MKRKSYTVGAAQPKRPPDCVTVTQTSGVAVTVDGYGRPNAKGTALEKMAWGTARYGDVDGYFDSS